MTFKELMIKVFNKYPLSEEDAKEAFDKMVIFEDINEGWCNIKIEITDTAIKIKPDLSSPFNNN